MGRGTRGLGEVRTGGKGPSACPAGLLRVGVAGRAAARCSRGQVASAQSEQRVSGDAARRVSGLRAPPGDWARDGRTTGSGLGGCGLGLQFGGTGRAVNLPPAA